MNSDLEGQLFYHASDLTSVVETWWLKITTSCLVTTQLGTILVSFSKINEQTALLSDS